MIKSTKIERAAVEARLRSALVNTKDSSLETTLNALTDMDDIEVVFLNLHNLYENLLVGEYNEYTFAGQYKGVGSKHDIDEQRRKFINAFNQLAELFSNHPEVRRKQAFTDAEIHRLSNGAAVVRRGKGIIILNQLPSFCKTCKQPLTTTDSNPNMCNACVLAPYLSTCDTCKNSFMSGASSTLQTCGHCNSLKVPTSPTTPVKKKFSLRATFGKIVDSIIES